MRNNDDVLYAFFWGVFVIGLLTLIWAVAKSMIVEWNIFKLNWLTLNIWGGLLVGLYLVQKSLREIKYYHKHKTMRYGHDERNWKILTFSLRNVGLGIMVTMCLVYMAFSLYNYFDKPIFSLISLNFLELAGVIIFFSSIWYYSRSKRL